MSYTHLNAKERFYVEQRLFEKDSVANIAATLGRHKASIYREIARNTDTSFGFYSGLRAETLSDSRP